VTACLAYWRKGAANGWLLAGLGLYALSFGHHLTTGLALPGIAWVVWSDRRRALTWRNVAFIAAACVVAAGQYLYLVRLSDRGRYHEADIDSAADVLTYVSGGDFKDAMFSFGLNELLAVRIPLILDYVAHELSVLLGLAAYGMVAGLRSASAAQRAVVVHLSWLAAATFIYAINFDVPDIVVFCLPLYLSLAVFVGPGLDRAVGSVQEHLVGTRSIAVALAAGLAMLVTAVGAVNHPHADQRGNTADAERMERALAAVGDGAVMLTEDYHDSEYLWYYLLGEGWADERDLALANQVRPADVEEYFTHRTGRVAAAASELDDATDPPLFTATPAQAESLAEAGLIVTPVGEDLWQVFDPSVTR
jgi:hypothetical protein